tara:strand:- start:1145 stop:1459 length:315 start_codon:yes stop_codon:yes gene_type:complete
MEIFITVLITLLFVAIIGAGINLVRLNRKAEELDTLKLEMVDLHEQINRNIEDMRRDLFDRINGVISSTDRRFDKLYNDLSVSVKRLKELDDIVNPNKDLLKNK